MRSQGTIRIRTTVIALLIAGSAVPSTAQAQATFQWLGRFSGDSASYVTGVSGDGSTVVGYGFHRYRARRCYSFRWFRRRCYWRWVHRTRPFRWTEAGGLEELVPAGTDSRIAYAASGDGSVIVGRLGGEPFVWTAAAGAQSIPNLPAGARLYTANGVSADGSVIVGRGIVPPQRGAPRPPWIHRPEAFRWSAPASLIGTAPLMADYSASLANDVSADGSVSVGWAYSRTRRSYAAFRWSDTDGLTWLDGGGANGWSMAKAVSADGNTVVGRTSDRSVSPYRTRPFRWTAASGLVQLPALNANHYAYATDVSADGSVVVGQSGGRAFIWDAVNGTRDLAQVLDSVYGISLGNGRLYYAAAISDDGMTIVGNGRNRNIRGMEGWIVRLPAANPKLEEVLVETSRVRTGLASALVESSRAGTGLATTVAENSRSRTGLAAVLIERRTP